MFFVKIEDKIQEFLFDDKKEAIHYIIDFLKRENFDEPVAFLKQAQKKIEADADIIITKDYTFKIFKMFHYAKCCVCEEPMKSNMKLGCKHFICQDCIVNLRKPECPICRQHISGKLVTDEVYCKILHNCEVDVLEEENNDQMMAVMSTFGYDVNELY